MYSPIQKLNLAVEKCQRLQVKSGLPDSLLATAVEHSQNVENYLIRMIQKSNETKATGEFSEAGLSKQIDKYVNEAKASYGLAYKPEVFDAKIALMKTDMRNGTASLRAKNKPSDPVLDYLQCQESRQWLMKARAEAEANKQAGKPYSDPVAQLFNECCTSYDSTKEQLFRAISEAPYPIELLSQGAISQGKELLERSLFPDKATGISCQEALKEMHEIIHGAVEEIIADPMGQTMRREDYVARPDGHLEPLEPIQ